MYRLQNRNLIVVRSQNNFRLISEHKQNITTIQQTKSILVFRGNRMNENEKKTNDFIYMSLENML